MIYVTLIQPCYYFYSLYKDVRLCPPFSLGAPVELSGLKEGEPIRASVQALAAAALVA